MRYIIIIILLLITNADLSAQTPADLASIQKAALDYIEGWFEGDAIRMENALHPELVKRIVVTDEQTDRDMIDDMGATKLVEGTRRGYGKDIPVEERRTEVTILDVTGRAATVRIDAGPWVDYMHLVKFNGEWKILNVLWERK